VRRVHTSARALEGNIWIFFSWAPLLYSVTFFFFTRNSPLIAHCNLTQPEEPVESLHGETEGARWTDTRDDWAEMQGILNDLRLFLMNGITTLPLTAVTESSKRLIILCTQCRASERKIFMNRLGFMSNSYRLKAH